VEFQLISHAVVITGGGADINTGYLWMYNLDLLLSRFSKDDSIDNTRVSTHLSLSLQ
jgi:hypothetical protein